jgi:cobalt-zinc-cadmium efflux system membrane fusion protein
MPSHGPTRPSFLLAAVATATVSACSSASSAEGHFDPPQSVPVAGEVKISPASRPYVKTVKLSPEANGAAVRAPAHLGFRDGAVSELTAPVAGRVTSVTVKVGDRVKAGDPLLTINSPDAAGARAGLAAAIASQKEAAEAAKRQQQMMAQGVGIESERVAAESRLAQANAELARAQAAAGFLGGGGGPDVVVRAPITGTVLGRRATVGAFFQAGEGPLVEIGDPSALWVTADVFERDLPLVQPGAAVDVQLAEQADPAHGKVVSAGSVVDPNLRTAPVYIQLDGDNPGARPGTYARVTIHSAGDAALLLPVNAVLVQDGKREVAYVKTGADTYKARDVNVGPVIDGHVRVISGLAPGDEVVVEGTLLLDATAEQLQ